MRLGRLMVAVFGATVLLTALVGAASAGRLSTSSQRLRATWARLNFGGGAGTVECEVVAEGSFHERTISKTVETLSGFITSANITRCSRGSATVLRESLPWHVRYASFTGTLPNITTIMARVFGVSFNIREPFGVTCLSRATASIAFNREAGGATTSATASGEGVCGGAVGNFSGTTSSFDNGSGTRITVTLI